MITAITFKHLNLNIKLFILVFLREICCIVSHLYFDTMNSYDHNIIKNY